MLADFIIAACTVGILICLAYIIFQVGRLRRERNYKKEEYTEEFDKDEIYASIEDDFYDD